MHIVLCCNQGMSTSMLVKKMREAAAKNGVDVQIDAYPISEIEEKAPTRPSSCSDRRCASN